MKKLTQHLKRAMAALAVADAGEMLTRRQMARVIHSRVEGHVIPQRQVAMWVGSHVSSATLADALSVCKRLDAGLCVLHAPGVETAQLHKSLGNHPVRYVALSGRPEVALRQFVTAHAQVAFLVLDGRNHADSALAQRVGNLGVPLVAVSAERPQHPTHAPHPTTPVAA